MSSYRPELAFDPFRLLLLLPELRLEVHSDRSEVRLLHMLLPEPRLSEDAKEVRLLLKLLPEPLRSASFEAIEVRLLLKLSALQRRK